MFEDFALWKTIQYSNITSKLKHRDSFGKGIRYTWTYMNLKIDILICPFKMVGMHFRGESKIFK